MEPKNQAPLIQATNLRKIFQGPEAPFELFHDISLTIHPHETISCVGRSGEGKSTLLHMLGGLEPPTSGSLSVLGKPTEEWSTETLRNSFFGFIFQSFHLLEEWDVLSNVLLPVRIARKPTSSRSFYGERARALLVTVGLEHRIQTRAKWLSGGEKQRVAIARALIMSPHIIFADEPTGNLDSISAAPVVELLFDAVAQENAALFLVTHQPDLATRCDKQYLLHHGSLELLQ
jgi:lipoprotein-releasing system ATP-binding protein